MKHKILPSITLAILICVCVNFSYADKLQLKEQAEGNEVEILEEQPDAFIIKIPKDEIEVIKRKKPTEIQIWRKKLIRWEDRGDYLVISLPKEKILSEAGEGEGYKPSQTLTEAVSSSGWDARPANILGVLTGKVKGKILKGGRPLTNCRVKLVKVATAGFDLTRFLSTEEKDKDKPGVFEAVTGPDGAYEFDNITIGDYDIYWAPQNAANWIRKLSDKPNITVKANQVTNYPDIRL